MLPGSLFIIKSILFPADYFVYEKSKILQEENFTIRALKGEFTTKEIKRFGLKICDECGKGIVPNSEAFIYIEKELKRVCSPCRCKRTTTEIDKIYNYYESKSFND